MFYYTGIKYVVSHALWNNLINNNENLFVIFPDKFIVSIVHLMINITEDTLVLCSFLLVMIAFIGKILSIEK